MSGDLATTRPRRLRHCQKEFLVGRVLPQACLFILGRTGADRDADLPLLLSSVVGVLRGSFDDGCFRRVDSSVMAAAPRTAGAVAASSIPVAAGGVQVTERRMVNLAALGEAPVPAITEPATPVQVEVVESTSFD